jgi:hypothetical protein
MNERVYSDFDWVPLILTGVLLSYHSFYEMKQMKKQKLKYFSYTMNYLDFSFMFFGYYNIWRQLMTVKTCVFSQIVLILVILMSLLKLFFFLRIYSQLTYIVTMIMTVASDL